MIPPRARLDRWGLPPGAPIPGKAEWINLLRFESADAVVGQTHTVEVEAFGMVTRYLGAPCTAVENGLATIDLNLAMGVERFRSHSS